MNPYNILLDSQIIVWLVMSDKRISNSAQRFIDNADNVYISAASVWELQIKIAKGKLTLPDNFAHELIVSGMHEMSVTFEHGQAIRNITLPQSDPFDKLLLAQAQVEQMRFLTADTEIISADFSFVVDARL